MKNIEIKKRINNRNIFRQQRSYHVQHMLVFRPVVYKKKPYYKEHTFKYLERFPGELPYTFNFSGAPSQKTKMLILKMLSVVFELTRLRTVPFHPCSYFL